MASSSRTLRVGFCSTANIGSKNFIAASIAPGVQVVAVSSRSLEKAQAWAKERNVPKAYGSHAELLADADIDAVYIPMPTGVRSAVIVAAAKAGKHVLSEKPIAPTAAEAATMIQACRDNNVVFMDGVMFMHNPRLSAIQKAIDAPEFGVLKRVIGDFSFSGDETFFGENIRVDRALEPLGCLGDLGIYNTRMAMFAYGWTKPEKVSAVAHTMKDGTNCRDIDDFTLAGEESTGCGFNLWREHGLTDNALLVTKKVEHVKVEYEHPQEVAMWIKFAELAQATAGEAREAERAFYANIALDTQKVLDACMESSLLEGAAVNVAE